MIYFPLLVSNGGFPCGTMVMNLPYKAGDTGDLGSIPGFGRSPVGGDGNPLQYSCLENSTEKELGRLQSMGSQIVGHDRATNTFTYLSFLGHEKKYVK